MRNILGNNIVIIPTTKGFRLESFENNVVKIPVSTCPKLTIDEEKDKLSPLSIEYEEYDVHFIKLTERTYMLVASKDYFTAYSIAMMYLQKTNTYGAETSINLCLYDREETYKKLVTEELEIALVKEILKSKNLAINIDYSVDNNLGHPAYVLKAEVTL